MAAPSGIGTTYNLPNYIGRLFQISITRTPFTSMLGGLGNYIEVDSPQFTWQFDDLPAAAYTGIIEGDEPTPSHRTRDDVLNVPQIHQEAVLVSYSKLAGTGLVATDNANIRANTANLGPQPINNEVAHQLDRKLLKIKRDFEFSCFQGTFQNPANNSTGRQTRGLGAAITTNVVAADSTDLSRDQLQELFRTMADNGAPFENVVLFANSLQKQRITDIYAYAPESRNVGGVNIEQVETDFGRLGVVYSPFTLASVVQAVEMSVCNIVAMPIPGKGVLFAEPLAKLGAYERVQIYGELGLAYGPETYHGEITGLTTS